MRLSMCNIRHGINEHDFEARRQMPQFGLVRVLASVS